MQSNKKRIIILGAGLAGLATAIRMRRQGYEVSVFEKNEKAGGKIDTFEKDGYRFDIGPSVLTMPEYIQELFKISGKNPEAYITFRRLDPVFQYYFKDGKKLTSYADVDKTANEWARETGEDKANIENFLRSVKEKYRLTEKVFLKNSLHQFKNYLNWEALRGTLLFHRVKAFKSMNSSNQKHFKSPYLRKLFNSFASYNGSDPFRAPATFNVIAHYEMNLGTFHPEGGMQKIPDVLYQLAKELGIDFHLNAVIEKINVKDGKATGIVSNGKSFQSDLVISCMDVNQTYNQLLKNQKRPNLYLDQEKSNSVLVGLWGMKSQTPELGVHNMFLPEDQKKEYQALFKENQMPDEPTFYIHIGSKLHAADAPENGENWFIYINAPKNKGQDWDQIIQKCRSVILERLKNNLGKDFSTEIAFEHYLTPQDFENRDRNIMGAIYGNSSNNIFSAFLRHPNFAPNIKDLYFAGGTVHPGSGIPLTLLSAEIVEKLITK